ncbi:MAG: hypothetical protein UR85_C0002G0028 [Candidatus Nomurabacteria bacterium GW2011_GWF2_35_66]|uniref:Uncharacterized protein n=1 Tax=Candidatus Nomurabacteria bacterium GW2011_GWE1_35_16 TaxID=1618761 RepID=A0A0G0EGR6_9BACT|nr:MAG: hypothetical protein UR55_C0007G0014 [Candidatus Nomurabacteria bacterium GW2011_GWF1_34_20]KKP63289.1 MAG: hypothetical protein UR57_C0006G0014 [Candidatus Nomurabacteria bacterium GW2011_GWE2_34_25]KKP66487.1 MAG: hypothetical protein UR64_C0006G0014 [Candidatus Nomurabacteria bacterium GW2011_GWE1_35_16]KKP83715.1 MAG: hypothetical protein UR85_C0002G0028 [Candidatus Nomurabacteria bacterium GW2011_GWF2_35_66]HAE36923.1 hypothetical protein [Candidatus Nomurabacteria bacterium]
MENDSKIIVHIDPFEAEFDSFKSNLIEFIRIHVSFKFDIQSLNFRIKYFFSRNKGGSIVIYCTDRNNLFEIINLLEKSELYSKRLGIEENTIKVNQLERFDIPEKITFLKKLFSKLEGLLPESFIIEPPTTILAGELNDEGFIRITLIFFKTDYVDQFISKIPNGWNYETLGLKRMVISLDLLDIKEFTLEKSDSLKNGKVNPIFIYPRNTFTEDDSLDINPSEKKLRYINPSISYFGKLFEDEDFETVKLPKKVDVDIGSSFMKKPIKIKEFKTKKQVKSDTMVTKDAGLTAITQSRKAYAGHFIARLQTVFTAFNSSIKLETGRFTYTAEGFDFSVPPQFSELVKNFLEKNKEPYKHKGSGKFSIIYSDKYSPPSPDKDESKVLIKLCGNERDSVLRILANNNYSHKKGGRAKKKPGVFGVSKTSNIAEHLMMILFISNKQLDTLNQIFKIVVNYYSDHEKKDLVNVRKDDKEFKIIVSYQQDFFKTEKDDNQNNQANDVINKNEEVLHQEGTSSTENAHEEIIVLAELAHEEEEDIDSQIEKLQQMKELKRREFLVSNYDSMTDIIWGCLTEKNIKIFVEETTEEEGLQSLSQVSVKKLKYLVSLKVLEKLRNK